MTNEVKTVPFITTLMGMFKFVENPIPVVQKAIRQYGKTYYTRIIGGRRIVMTVDPMVIQQVLQKNHKNYYKSELQTESLGRYVGKGLLTTNGPYWLRQRRLIQPGFHKTKLDGLAATIEDEVKRFCQNWKSKISSGSLTVDIYEEMMALTLRIVSKSLFGAGISDDGIRQLGQGITTLQKHIVKEVRLPVFNWWRILIGKRKEAEDLAAEIKQILWNIIEKRMDSGERHGDLLDMLIHSTYQDTGETMTRSQILDEALILFVAGHETTAVSLAWTIYLLDKNPDKIRPIRKEIENIDQYSLDSILKMRHTQNVISESMRMYPPAWIIDRVALEDDEINGVKIEKGDMIGLFIYGVHRNSDFWDSPGNFIPERFNSLINKEKIMKAFYPFGGGPRLCIGQQFALMEMKIALAGIYSEFNLKAVKEHPIVVEPLVTLRPKHGIKMEVRVAQS